MDFLKKIARDEVVSNGKERALKKEVNFKKIT